MSITGFNGDFRSEKINFDSIKSNKSWSFSDMGRNETLYATHGYHRYPAKFIPQLVRKLIIRYSKRGDIVLDSFGGCGTTLVEAKLSGRKSIGLDVNKVAVLISKAKTIEINTELLKKHNKLLLERIAKKVDNVNYYENANERLKYWFKPDQYNKLKKIYDCIEDEQNSKIKLFYKCCFSNILKNCSIWYSKSIKPMRDMSKADVEPLEVFKKHLDYMTIKNEDFVKLLGSKNAKNISCIVKKCDARKMRLSNEQIDLIVTSPPYVISYEYAELHQLSILWFGFADDIRKIKKEFVGASPRKRMGKDIDSKLAQAVLKKLSTKNKRLAKRIGNYYLDLARCYKEMHRVLKPGKYLCIVIGNTKYCGVKIPNAEITFELLKNLGFEVEKIIKRKLSFKTFTPYRDKAGKFTKTGHGNKKIYQHEYVIIARKRG